MHDASTKNNKKPKTVSVRLTRKTWIDLGEITKSTKLKKITQVDVLVEEEKNRRKKFSGVGSK